MYNDGVLFPQATATRDSLAKALYGALFDWIVDQVRCTPNLLSVVSCSTIVLHDCCCINTYLTLSSQVNISLSCGEKSVNKVS